MRSFDPGAFERLHSNHVERQQKLKGLTEQYYAEVIKPSKVMPPEKVKQVIDRVMKKPEHQSRTADNVRDPKVVISGPANSPCHTRLYEHAAICRIKKEKIALE